MWDTSQNRSRQPNLLSILFSPGRLIILALVILLGILPLFIWFFCRIEPKDGQIAVLIKKTGKPLPPDQILATDPDSRGIQLEVLGEGRYFRNPYVWDWQYHPITDIGPGSFAVLVRKFGKDLPPGEIIAPGDDYKGIVRDLLGTGKHRLNPYAYDVQISQDIRIKPGYVGVVTSQCGKDLFAGSTTDYGYHKGFVVKKGQKGILGSVLKEGTHRLNPFLYSVVLVNIQSQRYEFSGPNAITFLTQDGFTISLEGTVEYNIGIDAAASLTHEVGDMEDIVNKLILPAVSGFARIEGSKKTATEFIIGESRQKFQNELENFLKANSKPWGLSINSLLIRDIRPPQDIAEIIRKRELAAQEAKKLEQEILQAKSAQKLEEQKMLALQEKAVVEAQTSSITAKIEAQQRQATQVIAAKAKLDAAEVNLKKAKAETNAILTLAKAQQQVIQAQNISEANVLKQEISAYGDGKQYVVGLLYQKIGPAIESILVKEKPQGVLGLPIHVLPQRQSDSKSVKSSTKSMGDKQ